MGTIVIIVIIVICVLLWRLLRTGTDKTSIMAQHAETSGTKHTKRTKRAIPKSGVRFKWPTHGDFEFDVVGESHYQETIARLVGEHTTECADVQYEAELLPEDDNRYDSKAIAVRIQGQLVGYLSREDARSFRRRLGQKGLTGQVTTCDAWIVGGGRRKNGRKMYYGVKLDIKPFDF